MTGAFQQARVARVSQPGAFSLEAPEPGRLLAFEDDERPALGIAGGRRLGG